jgi:actin-related protein
VLSGGSAIPKGFRERFEKFLSESRFPVPVSGIRVANEPLYATAKGALVAALSDM